jgi:5-hydroxyisourate hydrolase
VTAGPPGSTAAGSTAPGSTAPGSTAPGESITLSTHVLDATAGRPAVGVEVWLEQLGPGGWAPAGRGRTGPDGRLALATPGPGLRPGVYRVTFGSGAYFAALGMASFYPEVTIIFELTGRGEHYHVPLLLSPFAYSTYRGS